MNDDKNNVARAWFLKAENDLAAARQIMLMATPPTDTVCFHAQQCAEKYLKGLLTYHQIAAPKTHSLEDLALLCEPAAPGIAAQLAEVEILTSYGVQVRYPDDLYYNIPLEDAVEALTIAEKVKRVVLDLTNI
jgi:HEPN domain-containing protein